MNILCAISLGELVDKITILRIKKIKILDDIKQVHIQNELLALEKTLQDAMNEAQNLSLKAALPPMKEELMQINQMLWNIEDQIREKEAQQNFDHEFIQLARSVYINNDKRFHIKNRINQNFKSQLVEVKSYKKY